MVAAVTGLLLLGWAPASWGHAVLVASDPAAGAELHTVPSVVTLTFDEPLVPSLSHATVTSPAGRDFSSTVSGKTMQVRMSGSSHGVYRVSWKTVSEIDGHTIQGTLRFGVAVPVTGAAVTEPGATTADFEVSVLRAFEYALVLLACGMALLEWLGRRTALHQPVVPVTAALLVSGILVVGAEVAIAGSGLSMVATADYLSNGLTGWARVGRLVLEAALLGHAMWRRQISALLLAGIIGAVAVAGHGADVEPAWQGMAVNAAHLAAAGIWVGGILALALVRLTGAWAGSGRDLLAGFSRVAIWGFAASVGLGAVQAYQLLGSPQPVLHTSYGLTLVAKSLAVLAMVPLSWLAWRRAREHVRGEAVLALVVVAAAAALAAFPVVPKEAREAAEEAADTTDPGAAATAFPRSGDLTLGGRAGQVMVGLTLHPGRPGMNTVTAYLASPAGRGTRARVEVGGRSVDLDSCGTRCRSGTIRLRGGQLLAVHVAGEGTATYHLPRLPAADGSALVRSAQRRMGALASYRVDETLAGFHTRYLYQRPNRLFARTRFGDGMHATLWLGRRLYRGSGRDRPWHLETKGPLAPVPYYPWYPFRPLVDAHVVGSAHLQGRRVEVVSVFAGHGKDPEAVWFTLYVVPGTNDVVRSRMWATNHFMLDRYSDLDGRVRIPSPDVSPR
ncbi:MAG TPA: copper resistance protein CopC [Nocardioides sp.]